MGHVVIPLWQLSPRKNGMYPRSKALPNMQTFEEFYAQVLPGKSLTGNRMYEALRIIADPQLAMFRVALLPPNASEEATAAMRRGFGKLWEDQKFLADYSKVIKTEPILVTGNEGQAVLTGLGTIRDEMKEFIGNYISSLTNR